MAAVGLLANDRKSHKQSQQGNVFMQCKKKSLTNTWVSLNLRVQGLKAHLLNDRFQVVIRALILCEKNMKKTIAAIDSFEAET